MFSPDKVSFLLKLPINEQQSKLIAVRFSLKPDHHPKRDRQNDQPSGETSARQVGSSEPNQDRQASEHIDSA